MCISTNRIGEPVPIPGTTKVKIKINGYTLVEEAGKYNAGSYVVFIPVNLIIPKSLVGLGDEKSKMRVAPRIIEGVMSEGYLLTLREFYDNVHGDSYWGNFNYFVSSVTRYNRMGLHNFSYKLDFKEFKHHAIPLVKEPGGIYTYSFMSNPMYNLREMNTSAKNIENKRYYITTRLDGISVVYSKDYQSAFSVHYRGKKIKDGDNLLWNIARKYDLQNKMTNSTVIGGEIVGPKVYGNTSGREENTLYVFTMGVSNPMTKVITYPDNRLRAKALGLKFVPVEEVGMSSNLTFDEMIEKAKGNYPNGKPKEGIVISTWDEGCKFVVDNMQYLVQG